MTIKTSYAPGEPIWVDLASPDLDKSIAFYGSLFGWTCDQSRGEEFGGYANFSKDGKKVAGIMPLMQEGMPAVWSCYVCTDDADKTTAKVTEAGGSVVAPPMAVAELGTMAVYSATDGSFFGVWQPGEHLGSERVKEEGCFAWAELSTRNQEAAIPFYEAVFGWSANRQEGYTEFQLGGTSVAGCMDTPEMVPAEVPSYWMPYFGADDPAAKAQEVASLGGTVLVPLVEMDQLSFSVVADPHGSAFGLLKMNA
ncbi:MAG: Glyoxalase/bleomycin resistance protein/dioxygenase [Frankiales bacterium]|jgi:predicted enzyme related to lactoylglutathione lyase|nr:Glyoxalase/bleomycin resistance protein/dioxygenase [Frankiales bacterium]